MKAKVADSLKVFISMITLANSLDFDSEPETEESRYFITNAPKLVGAEALSQPKSALRS